MSSVELVSEERTIARTGGTAAAYIPKELRNYISIGDIVNIRGRIEGDKIVMIISKRLFKFDLDDIKKILLKYDFKNTKEETIGDVEIFQTNNNEISISYTKNLLETTSPGYITVKKVFQNIDFKKYNDLLKTSKKLEEFDVIIRPEGDLDTIKLLRNPNSYQITMKQAFTALEKAKKKISFSVVIRLNSRDNTVEHLQSAIKSLDD